MAMEKQEKRRQMILKAAEKLFARNGFHGTDVEAIAKQAGTAKGTVYNYFENKEDIFLSVLDDGLHELEEQMRLELVNVDDPVEKIKKGIEIYIYFLADHLHLFKILAGEQAQFGDKFRKRKHEEFFARIGHVELIIGTAIEEGHLKKVDPFIATTGLFGMINFSVFRGLLLGKKFSARHMTEQITKLYLEGMLP
jgi:AcrR family transcriptional regulator